MSASAPKGGVGPGLKSKIVIALSASPSSAHALQWAADNILDVAKHTVVLISVIEAPVEAGYYFDSAVSMSTLRLDAAPATLLTRACVRSNVQRRLHR